MIKLVFFVKSTNQPDSRNLDK